MGGRAIQEMKARTYTAGSAKISRGIGAAIARCREKSARRRPVAVTAQREAADAEAIAAFIAACGVKKIETKEAEGAVNLNYRGFAGYDAGIVFDRNNFAQEFTVDAPDKPWEEKRDGHGAGRRDD